MQAESVLSDDVDAVSSPRSVHKLHRLAVKLEIEANAMREKAHDDDGK